MPDGNEAAFKVLEAFPNRDQPLELMVEEMNRFHQVAAAQVGWLGERHPGYELVALIDGLVNIAGGFLDVRATELKVIRQILLDRLHTIVMDRLERERDDQGQGQ
jgi:hypothetical protein